MYIPLLLFIKIGSSTKTIILETGHTIKVKNSFLTNLPSFQFFDKHSIKKWGHIIGLSVLILTCTMYYCTCTVLTVHDMQYMQEHSNEPRQILGIGACYCNVFLRFVWIADEAQMMLTLQITNKTKSTRKVNIFDSYNIFKR